MDPSPPPSSPLAPANFDPAVNAYYAPIASALSLAGGILLAVWSWRASTVVQCDHHDAAVLKILMCLGLADAYFALGWLVLTYEACIAGNVMVFTGTAAQATWTMVLAWYLCQALLEVRSATIWQRWRAAVYLFGWGLPVLSVVLLLVPSWTGTCATNAPIFPGPDMRESLGRTADVFFLYYLLVPTVAAAYCGFTYVRIMFAWRRMVGRHAATALPLDLRLSSYLFAYLVGQGGTIAYHLATLAGCGFQERCDLDRELVGLQWVWCLTMPVQGLLDAVVYLHHACKRRGLSAATWALLWPRRNDTVDDSSAITPRTTTDAMAERLLASGGPTVDARSHDRGGG